MDNKGCSASAPPEYTQDAYPNNPQNAYPGYPQNAYPVQPQNAYPGYPQNAYVVQPQNAYPNYPQSANPGYPQVAAVSVSALQPVISNPPRDYLIFSILGTIFCCFWIGIFAIIKSVSVRTAVAVGNRTQAEMDSNSAKVANIVNVCLGVAMWVSIIGYYAWYASVLASVYSNRY